MLSPPYLSSDIYRYVWDGRVMAAGINPYRYVPADPHLEALRDPDIFPADQSRQLGGRRSIRRSRRRSFLAVTRVSESVTAMKAAMVGFEVFTFVLLVRLLAASRACRRRGSLSMPGTRCRYGNLPAAAISTPR